VVGAPGFEPVGLLRPRQEQEREVVGSSSTFLCHASRFCTPFGNVRSQIVPTGIPRPIERVMDQWRGPQNRAMLLVRLLHAVVLCGLSDSAKLRIPALRFLRSFSA